MKVRELRIGNYFLDDENNISKCNGFNPFGHSVRCDEQEGCDVLLDYFKNGKWHTNYECDINDCRPIELTEQLLLKCGFTAKSIHDNYMLNGIELSSCVTVISTNERKSFYMDGYIPDFMKIKIEYLHQLQNIYYALTGTELEINL